MVHLRTSPGARSHWIALLAVLALLAQGLWPASAMPSASPDGGFYIQMCTPDGLQAAGDAPTGDGADRHDCCGLCVMGALAAALPGTGPALSVRYAAQIRMPDAGVASPSARARDPPRPPSQGPPRTV